MPECHHIFVYGTLRDPSVNHKAHFLRTKGIYVCKATIFARLFKVSWYPAILLDNTMSNKVYGEIFEIPIAVTEMVLKELDEYEGIYSTNEESDEYERVVTEATSFEGEVIQCWVYNYKAPLKPSDIQIIEGDYLEFLRTERN